MSRPASLCALGPDLGGALLENFSKGCSTANQIAAARKWHHSATAALQTSANALTVLAVRRWQLLLLAAPLGQSAKWQCTTHALDP